MPARIWVPQTLVGDRYYRLEPSVGSSTVPSAFGRARSPRSGERGVWPHVAVEVDRGKLLSAISNAVVGVHREHYGRGAETVRTLIQGDCVVCVLEGIYTTGEKTLIAANNFGAVREGRQTFQDAMRDTFVGEVEGLTGRDVVAFFSAISPDPDMGIEVFVLAAEGT